MKEYYICKVSNFVNSIDCPGLRIVENDIVKYLGQDILTYNGISMDVFMFETTCLFHYRFYVYSCNMFCFEKMTK